MAAHRKSDRHRDDLCAGGLRKRATSSGAALLPSCSHSVANLLEVFANVIGTICDMPLQYAAMSGPCLVFNGDSKARWWRGALLILEQLIGKKEIPTREVIHGCESFSRRS